MEWHDGDVYAESLVRLHEGFRTDLDVLKLFLSRQGISPGSCKLNYVKSTRCSDFFFHLPVQNLALKLVIVEGL